MLSWFNAREEQQFGTTLARFYIDRVPYEAPFSKNKFATKTQDVLKKIDLQVNQFKQGRQLNIYKKAKLGNAFKWALRDAGYEVDYVNDLTEWLMLRM
jgi:GDP-D-mannose dehydratase